MSVVRSFHRYRGESSITMPRFITILREQLPKIAPVQTKYRVTDVPSERTIRFYTAKGVVDKPLGREGTMAIYGYRHLLQILAVKHLQAQYFPLVKIKSIVQSVSNRELELLIPEHPTAAVGLRGVLRENHQLVDNTSVHRVEKHAFQQQVPCASDPAGGEIQESQDAWHRIDVAPGIELQVHTTALSAQDRERLRGALLRELGALRGWQARGKN